jgi:DNA repair protein RecN (Recombination protein N)
VRQHLELLDRYAGNEDLLQAYREIYARLREVRSELERLRQSERDAARRVDLLGYQINEIESARLNPDEEEELRQERNRLANAESLASLTQEILLALDEGDPESPAATDLLGNAMNALGNLARTDPSQSELRDQAQTLFDQLGELGRDLRVYQEGIEFNPKRLSWVEERLDLIFNLKRKYGDSIEEVLTFCDNARDELKTIEGAEARIAELEKDEQELIVVLLKCGQKLSKARHKAAETLSKAIEGELDDLRMDQARFKVDFQHRLDPMGVLIEDDRRIAFDSTGLDQVEFLVAPNPGEGFKPLIKIASGGETSRLMLALKNVLARADQTPTLIFDEIDQGIGGRVGAIVGQKLWSLTRGGHQVMCITHLPQLAAFGEQHYQVQKDMVHGRTITQVALLDGDNRVYELAQMMGELSDGTVQSAKDILQTVQDTIA